MKVKELKKKLEKYEDDLEVVIDFDENGFYNLEQVLRQTDEDDKEFINLVSSNEA